MCALGNAWRCSALVRFGQQEAAWARFVRRDARDYKRGGPDPTRGPLIFLAGLAIEERLV